MKKLLYNLGVYVLFGVNAAYASVIHVKVTGEQVDWKNAEVESSNVVHQLNWQRSDRFNMLPVKSWTPKFMKSNLSTIKFTSNVGASFSTAFNDKGIDFRTSNSYERQQGAIGASNVCPSPSQLAGSDMILRGSESCVLDYTLNQKSKLRPFDFYRVAFQLPRLVQDLKNQKVPAGRYVASFSVPIAYYLNYEKNDIDSYQIYQDSVMLILDYKPSFISNVTTLGNGRFKMDYDKIQHIVDGETTYNIFVKGQFASGIRMSFLSSDKNDDFSLVSENNQNRIPYNLFCDMCSEDNYPIKDGIMEKDYAKIPGQGNNLNFKLKFYFEDVQHGQVEEGDYSDAVTVIFEPDI